MTATTATYLELERVYRNRAETDAAFVETHLSRLLTSEPLSLQGSIPDMTATTAAYLELQRVYRDRAEANAAAVEAHLSRLLTSIGREPGSIAPAAVRAFCRNARNIR